MTPAQCRKARRLLGISRETLAELARVPVWQIKDFEGRGHLRFAFYASQDRVGEMRKGLEAAGVAFTTDGEQLGVTLRKAEG